MTPASYETRMRRVLRYIHDNPAADMSLDALADVAAMSRFHWHRVYTAMTGETCAQAVRRVRMHRASFMLAQGDLPIDEIARRVGYANPQSFTRSFREVFGQTPHAFRSKGTPSVAEFTLKSGDPTMYSVEIQSVPKRRLAAILHKGPYTEIGQAYEQLGAIFAARQLFSEMRGVAAVYYNDPDNTPPADLRSHAGHIVTDAFSMPDDLDEVVLESGTCAVLTLKGPYTGLQAAYGYLFGPWLAGSGQELAEAPSYEVYLNSPMYTAPDELLTAIHVPLKS